MKVQKEMNPSPIIIIVAPYSPPPKRMSKLKHRYRWCKQRVSCISWRQLVDILAKLGSIVRSVAEIVEFFTVLPI